MYVFDECHKRRMKPGEAWTLIGPEFEIEYYDITKITTRHRYDTIRSAIDVLNYELMYETKGVCIFLPICLIWVIFRSP